MQKDIQKDEALDTVSRVKLLEVKDGEGRELEGHRSTSTRRDKLRGLLFSRVTLAHDTMHLTTTRSQAGEMLGG